MQQLVLENKVLEDESHLDESDIWWAVIRRQRVASCAWLTSCSLLCFCPCCTRRPNVTVKMRVNLGENNFCLFVSDPARKSYFLALKDECKMVHTVDSQHSLAVIHPPVDDLA